MTPHIDGLTLALIAVIVVYAYRLGSAKRREAQLRCDLHKALCEKEQAEQQVSSLTSVIKSSAGGLQALRAFLRGMTEEAVTRARKLDSLEERVRRGVV